MSDSDANSGDRAMPWLAIAGGLAALGVVVAVTLGTAEPPDEPVPAQLVRRTVPDVGSWDPFPPPDAQDTVADAIEEAERAVMPEVRPSDGSERVGKADVGG